ncbi:ComEA family DNA-binding protein, partial [Nonomuraea indica]|uniref:ComEA family DNA-binding protein n=1 Tax=Nonomuraea indica TaxID=1581193 RepID=UPI001FE9C8FE
MPATLQAFRAALEAKAPGLAPGGPALKALVALAVLAAIVAGISVWRSQPVPEPLPAPASPPPASHRHVPATPSSTASVTVHVTGKVRKPGIYTLPMGARVADAVTAAGGARHATATASVNLARRLLDGEQILIGAPPGAAVPAAPVPAPGTDPAATVLDLNTATAEQLEQLPGVGEVLAARIAEFRTANGGFTSVAQLQEVPGIGPPKQTRELKLGCYDPQAR